MRRAYPRYRRIFPILLWFVLSMMARLAYSGESPDAVRAMLEHSSQKSFSERMDLFSSAFLGLPYRHGALGEGPSGRFDRDPLYRFDAFDCMTFVETVLALSLSSEFSEFERTLSRIRYRGGNVDYLSRNHFPDLEWIPSNVGEGFIRDITEELAPGRSKVATTVIDRKGWYLKRQPADIQVPGLSRGQKKAMLMELRALGRSPATVVAEAQVRYLPLDYVLDGDPKLFDRIPSGAILNVVRPNWRPQEDQGTRMNISHQGIVIRKKDGSLVFRHATLDRRPRRVVEVPLKTYLRELTATRSIRGINLLEGISKP
jgi:hypothetical protein